MKKNINMYYYDGENLIQYTACYDADKVDQFLTKIKNRYTTRKRILLKEIDAKYPLVGQVECYDEIVKPKIIKNNRYAKDGRIVTFGDPILVDVKATVINYPKIYKVLHSIIETGEIDFKELLHLCTKDGTNKQKADYDNAEIIIRFFCLLDFQINSYYDFETVIALKVNPLYAEEFPKRAKEMSEALQKAIRDTKFIRNFDLSSILPQIGDADLNNVNTLNRSK